MQLTISNDSERAPVRPRVVLARLCCMLLLPLMPVAQAAAAGPQPDLMVRLASEPDASYLGEGVYEGSVLTQSKSQAAFSGTAAQFRVLLKNAGAAPDSFLVRGTGSADTFTVRYLDQEGGDLAELPGQGWATPTLSPGESLSLLVQVTPSEAMLGASFRVTVSASSASDPARFDQVKTETVACGSTAAVTVSAPPDGSGHPGSVVNYPYTVTNVGSAGNSFILSAANSTGWSSAIYADDGAAGGIAGDGVRQGGENRQAVSTGPLAPGAAYRFFVAVTVPHSSADGAHGDAGLSVIGEGAGGYDQVTTRAIAAVVSVAESVRNLTRGGPFAATGSALPGDTLEYRLAVTNSGSAPATSVGIDNTLPGHTLCLPESLWIGTSPGGDGPPCEAARCGWVRVSAGGIAARLGQGTTEVAGGTLAPGKTLYVYFRVQVE